MPISRSCATAGTTSSCTPTTRTATTRVELRFYGVDPDAAEARARARGDTVLAGAADKPHGLRESYLVDPDGYVWVPGVAIGP